MALPWMLCGLLLVITCLLSIKVWILKKGMDEICKELQFHFSEETNTLITILTRDAHVRHIANTLNEQLRILRKQRHQYVSGSKEVKDAVTNISHDLRTPLTAICGYLDLLEEEEVSSDVKRYLNIIANRVEMMQQLTEELFHYSMITSTNPSLHKEDVVLNNLMEESIAAYYSTLKKRGIEPIVEIPEEKVHRYVDASMLSRVISNILHNAMKYSDGDLHICLTKTGTMTFTNTASTLHPVQVAKLFDRFYTVNNVEHSTGLGLEIARTLVEQMQGTISAEYHDQKLTICVHLPDTEEEPSIQK